MKHIQLKSMLLALIISLFLVGTGYSQPVYKQSFKFAKFLDYLDSYYFDSIDSEIIVEDAIKSILDELDPHSAYYSADEIKRMREPLQGNFEGIGIQFNILKDTLYVVAAISGGPSEKVGIRAGDKIIKVDDENIAGVGLTNEDVFSLLRGEKGTKVTVSVQRRGEQDLIDFLIIRDKIPLFSLDASYMINENTGYIKINRFSATTINEFSEASNELIKSGAQNLVLDLTNNGGGYLDAAVRLADEFLDQNKLVVFTKGLHSPRREYFTSDQGRFEEGKVIVLIEDGSASASEIVTGAIQDWDRGIVIGRRSFGKGLVQREMLLPDESAIRLTVAQYFTPTGRLIQKSYDHGTADYHKEVFDRYTSGEMISKDSIHFPDSLKYKTLVNNRTVFGGGGITPDIFVPFDTSFYSSYYRDLMRKGIINQFVLEYVDNNRNKLNKSYVGFTQFDTEFVIDEKLMNKFVSYASDQGVEKVDSDLALSGDYIKVIIKALVARDIYGETEFYQVLNPSDPIYRQALEVIDNWDKYYNSIMH